MLQLGSYAGGLNSSCQTFLNRFRSHCDTPDRFGRISGHRQRMGCGFDSSKEGGRGKIIYFFKLFYH